MPITAEHLDQYYQHGYVIVPNFLTAEELRTAQAEMRRYYPPWAEYAARADAPAPTPFLTFPFAGDVLSRVATHPDLVRFAQRVLGTEDVALHQSSLHGKYAGGPSDEEQALHVDYINHTLAYPSANPAYWQITTILYYTDVTAELAPTYVVSWEHTCDELLVPSARPRETSPELYAHERPAIAPAGSLLIYNTRTFHRGSAFRGPGERVVHFIAYGPAAVRWIGIVGWPRRALAPEMQRFMAQATPAERHLLGFPPPGHEYWTAETLAGVAARYPGMDMTPYRAAAPPGERPAGSEV